MIVTKNNQKKSNYNKKQQKNLLYCKMPFILICHTLNNNNNNSSLKNMAKREKHKHTRAHTQKTQHAKRRKRPRERQREREALDLKMYSFDQCLHRGSLKFIKKFLLFFSKFTRLHTKVLEFLELQLEIFFSIFLPQSSIKT